jgi:hypothetical protein
VVLITLIVGSLLPTPAPDTWAAKFGSPLTDLQVFRHLFEAQRGGGWWKNGASHRKNMEKPEENHGKMVISPRNNGDLNGIYSR